MQDVRKRAERYYDIYRISKFIKYGQKLVKEYNKIKNSSDIRKAYLDKIDTGNCNICNYAGTVSRSCKSCSIYVVSGMICTGDYTYMQLDDLCDRHTPKASMKRILNARIEFHENIILKLKIIKNELIEKR